MRTFFLPQLSRRGFIPLLHASAMLTACLVISLCKSQQPEQNVDWRYYGNDHANTRFQNVDQITTTNVSQLQVAWVFHTGVNDPHLTMEMSPIVIHGTMYVTTGEDDVFALNAATGKERWHYHPTDMPALSLLPLCCGYSNRGVAYGRGLIFDARLDATLVALNAWNGHLVWKATVDDWHAGYTMTIAPQYVDGMVIVGVSGGEFLTRGHVDAYDARTGRRLWRFYTTEPTTWAGNSYLKGGAPVWQNPTYDRGLGLLYITTGNPGPVINGTSRAGTNLYSVCVLALDAKTGNLRWYFQESHHDLWDYDATSPAVLFDLNGTPALAHQGKTGYTFILDRRTGKPLYPVNELPVPTTPSWQNPWPTQPESVVESMTPHSVDSAPAGYTAAPMWTPPQEVPLLVQPGTSGGHEWPPDAYSPRTKFLYQHANYVPEVYQSPGDPITPWGSSTDWSPGVPTYGKYGATDTTTGTIAWQITVPQAALSGWLVAGDVAFFGEGNSLFHAVDAATGKTLWTFNAQTVSGVDWDTAVPIAYVVDGREYIVNGFRCNPSGTNASLGDTIVAFSLPPR